MVRGKYKARAANRADLAAETARADDAERRALRAERDLTVKVEAFEKRCSAADAELKELRRLVGEQTSSKVERLTAECERLRSERDDARRLGTDTQEKWGKLVNYVVGLLIARLGVSRYQALELVSGALGWGRPILDKALVAEVDKGNITAEQAMALAYSRGQRNAKFDKENGLELEDVKVTAWRSSAAGNSFVDAFVDGWLDDVTDEAVSQ